MILIKLLKHWNPDFTMHRTHTFSSLCHLCFFFIRLTRWYVDYLRFRSLRSSGLWQEQVSSPSSSVGSRRVVAAVAWADGTAPAACSAQLESASWNTYNAKNRTVLEQSKAFASFTDSFTVTKLLFWHLKKNIHEWFFFSSLARVNSK